MENLQDTIFIRLRLSKPYSDIVEDLRLYEQLFRPKATPSWNDIIRNDPCSYCGRVITNPGKRSREHIVPESRGGRGSWDNIVNACTNCNGNRGNTLLLEWLINTPKGVLMFWSQTDGPFFNERWGQL